MSQNEHADEQQQAGAGTSEAGVNSNRRALLTALGGGLGLVIAGKVTAATIGPLDPVHRGNKAFDIRRDQAKSNHDATENSAQPTNGDEEAYPNYIGSYSKGLPHDSNTGEVNVAAYGTMLNALRSGAPNAFENITLGGNRKLTNPQSGLAFELEGGDGANFRIPPPPAFASRETAAEISENYWMALLRDVAFSDYATDPIANAAAADLTLYGADAKVPKTASGQVTPDLLFRGLTPGDTVGPYLSQFFYQPCPFGFNQIVQQGRHPLAGVNFATDWDSFISLQNGGSSPALGLQDGVRYMRNGRGIGQWVHLDTLYQAYFMAYLVLGGLGAPLDPANPYTSSRTQIGFGTFGDPHIATILTEVATRAVHATWYQKWFAHRRLRPEAYAGAVHARAHRSLSADRAPVHTDILNSVNSASRLGGYLTPGSALLPLAFPEGSPTHPSYTAGHATVAGACVTVLKAFFDESWVIPNAVQSNVDGTALVPYTANALTVGGELNKIASNVGIGRNIAGVHWRSDFAQSVKLGEAIAIQLMREQAATFNETFSGNSLTKFDGTTIKV